MTSCKFSIASASSNAVKTQIGGGGGGGEVGVAKGEDRACRL